MEGGYVGHETNAGCPCPDIELSPCIKTGKNNKHNETEGKNRTRADKFLNNIFNEYKKDIIFLGAAAVEHLFHASHNCPPWQYAPSAPSWRLFHKHSTTAALLVPAEPHVHNGFPIPFF
jgi:hypothetical protein